MQLLARGGHRGLLAGPKSSTAGCSSRIAVTPYGGNAYPERRGQLRRQLQGLVVELKDMENSKSHSYLIVVWFELSQFAKR